MTDFKNEKDLTDDVKAALSLVLNHAYGDTGGSRRCAEFLLSLWNGDTFKADLQNLLYVDNEIFLAYINILGFLYGSSDQIYTYLTDKHMQPVLKRWGSLFNTRLDS